MADFLTTLLSNDDVLSIIIALVINLGWLYYSIYGRRHTKSSIPTKLFLLNLFIWLGLFINAGMMSPIYAMIFIIIVSGLITYLYINQFAHGAVGSQKIMLSYIVFFVAMSFFQGLILITADTAVVNIPKFEGIVCEAGVLGTGYIQCAGAYLGQFLELLKTNRELATIYTILLVPFIFFIAQYLFNWLRGVS